ncbi:MAG TPA: AAA family ATPase [Candidatus Faecisoma merdavium]|nr:AAA family ATPase [Candidatus Faecisoma merdavium]
MFLNYMEEKNLNRLALVGTNSQGKSYMIAQEFKGAKGKKAILVTNEVKADENLKNSTDTSTLITWLNSLLDNTNAKKALQDEIDKVDLSSINDNSFLNVSLNNNLESYKGIISANIETDSNQWRKPGSGEKFLGQLLLISKILEDNKDDTYEYLVIDEPEQHLHPSLYIKVAKILNKISKQGIKVIIATHSPIITQYFIDDTIEICKVVNGTCNFLPSFNELIQLSQDFDCYKNESLKLKDYKAIEGKFELYFKNFVFPILLKSLFCNYMILGEGAIERKIFELYLLKYGSNFEKNDIDYAIVDGKIFFPIVISALKKLGIKILTLYDLDAENQSEHSYLNKTIEDLSDKVISFKPKIENYLNITKEMCNDKFRGLVILMSEFYLDDNDKLIELLNYINQKLEELKQ